MEQTRATPVALLLQATPWTPLDVRRGSVAEVSVHVPATGEEDGEPASECLVWQFELDEFDIDFLVLCNDVAAHKTGRYKADEILAGAVESNVVPTLASMTAPMDVQTEERSGQLPFEGRLEELQPGDTVVLIWDNSYSLVRHKRVRYRHLLISYQALKAAECAVQAMQERARKRPGRTNQRLPYWAAQLTEERALSVEDRAKMHQVLADRVEESVMDVVAIFMANPNCPLHEGAVRTLVLALEAVLRSGIKEDYVGDWPEEPYYEFLAEIATVLRDDTGVVAEVEALTIPIHLQCLGWTYSRALILVALTRNMFHRAFENLTKRRALIEKYYDSYALVYDYPTAAKITSFLSALNAVQFLLAPFPMLTDRDSIDPQRYPINLQQCSPSEAFESDTISFLDSITGDGRVTRGIDAAPDEMNHVELCSISRYLLHSTPFEELTIGRGSTESLRVYHSESDDFVMAAQVKVHAQDILLSVVDGDGGGELTESLRIAATDQWVELVLRFHSHGFAGRTVRILLDNSFSMVRAKQVQVRFLFTSVQAYNQAWLGCLEMAQSMTWKLAAETGQQRCDEFMASQSRIEEEAVMLQRESSGESIDDGSTVGFRSSLIDNPVSRLVGGLLTSDASAPTACWLCLTPFSFFSRQRSCPICQEVVCIPCSRHYMQVNGKESQLKVCDRCFVKEKDRERARVSNSDTSGGKEVPEFVALRADPTMEKYFKMLAFGVPPSAVAQKIIQDEMPAAKLAVFRAGPDGTGGENSRGAALRTRASKSVGNPRDNFHRRDSTFRKVHWTSLEETKANRTIWARQTSRRKTAPIKLSPHDFRELEDLFGTQAAAATSDKSQQTGGSKRKKPLHSVLDPQRSNNISIGLSQFKAIGGTQAILQGLTTCDREFLTSERLETLQEIAPNAIEVKRYTNFRGARSRLEPAELFLVQMCEISRVTEKIGVLLFAVQFKHQITELSNRMGAITKACYQILESERLPRCFELVLTIGNLLNAGTEMEDAHGVTLPSLLKLSETKSIDRSMTLLQFIIKLIHDRGEGDILLFVNDLSALADAKRLSNVTCEAQFRSLQYGIVQVENEIKEEMADDVRRFNKEEERRKRLHDEAHRPQAPVDSVNTRTIANDSGSNPRAALLESIRQRDSNGTTKDAERTTELGLSQTASNNPDSARSALLDSIRMRAKLQHGQDAHAGGDQATTQDGIAQAATAANSKETDTTRTSMVSATRQHQPESDEPTASRESIPKMPDREPLILVANQNGKRSEGAGAPPDLLAAIRNRKKPPTATRSRNGDSENAISEPREPYTPREYKVTSKFIPAMRTAVFDMKAALDDVELELETLQSVWEATARYLGEEPARASSDYVMSLLNRFVLDVKVAKSLLARTGLSFTSTGDLLPDAHVGSTVLTAFGGGVVTALRAAEQRIEVRFPWPAEGWLLPSAVISAGCLVRCRWFGVGILRATMYDRGLCSVRFPFGVGVVRVSDLVPEMSSDAAELRASVLRSRVCVDDPVVTPFGCGVVIRMDRRPRNLERNVQEERVVAIDLSTADTSKRTTEEGDQRGNNTIVAYVYESRVQLNY